MASQVSEDDIQAELLREYRQHSTTAIGYRTYNDNPLRHSILPPHSGRTTRAWSWPLDRQQARPLRATSKRPLRSGASARDKPKPKDIIFASFSRSFTIGLSAVFLGCLLVFVTRGCWIYLTTPPPAILQGWSESCPPNWLYTTSPDMLLMGYQRRFEDVCPPWSALRSSEKAYLRCWHSDRNRAHQGNHMNVTFPGPQADHNDASNRLILQRYEMAMEQFDDCEYPWTLSEAGQPKDDGLPQLASMCKQRCGFRNAAYLLFLTTFDRSYDPTMSSLNTVAALPEYCPCSFQLAWHSLRRTHEHLPKPRSIHPFYTNRNVSSLYRSQDMYSWWVWLWGNNFFSPWRRTSIEQVSDEEWRELCVEGHWTVNMDSGSRFLAGAELRKARGVGVSKKEREEMELICQGRDSCMEMWNMG